MGRSKAEGRPTILILDSKPMFGGGQRMIAEFVRALDRYRVVVVRPHDAPEDPGVHWADAVIHVPFPHWPVGMSSLGGMVAALPGALVAANRLGRLVQRERPALVIVNDLYAAIPLVLLAGVGILPRWCFWIHSCDLPQGRAVRWLLGRAQAMVGVSKAAAAPWHRSGLPPVTVIRNAVTMAVVDAHAEPHPRPWTVLVAGRLDANKNIVGFLTAWSLAKSTLEMQGPARLLIAGDGPERAAVEHHLRALGIHQVVQCLGWCSDLPGLMATVDAVALVSHAEALGLTLVEAQMLGRAVLGTPVGGIPEIIRDGVTGILAKSAAPADLAEALLRLREDGHRLAPAGQAVARQVFAPERFQREVAELVDHLIATGRPPPPRLADYAAIEGRAVRSEGIEPRVPVLSVITVVRNGRHLLEKCCASIRAQTVPNIEHIIIDGASTDGTREWLVEHGRDLGAWISEPDLGISDAFNKGIALARGEFIGLLNADDVWLPETAAHSIAALRADSTAAWSFGGCDFTIDDRVVLRRDGDADYRRTIHRWMPAMNHPTVVVRRSSYERHGLFRTELRLAMDYDLLLRLHRGGEHGICIPRTLAQMALGGVSNGRGVVRAHHEAAQVAMAHGRPAVWAHVDRMRLNVLPRLRALAIRVGLQGPWRRFRGRPIRS